MAGESKKGAYRKFRELLRCGIGDRSQRSFAKEAGITPEHVNRLLNSETISQPSRETLEKMASVMNTVSLNELLEACGYQTVDPNETARRAYDLLTEGYDTLTKGRLTAWDSLEELLDILAKQYSGEDGAFSVLCQREYHGTKEESYAEQCALLKYQWADIDYAYKLFFLILYNRTERGKILFVNLIGGMDKIIEQEGRYMERYCGLRRFSDEMGCYTFADRREQKKSSREEASLLSAIFSMDGYFIKTDVGYGFYYRETPAGFLDFLTAHAAAFTTTKENAAMYQAALEPGADLDEIFKDFEDSYTETNGTGAVVCQILRKETGKEFLYLPKDENIEDEEDDSCIIVEEETGVERWMPEDLLFAIYDAARLLKLPKFGVCYHRYTEVRTHMQDYSTETFHREFRK